MVKIVQLGDSGGHEAGNGNELSWSQTKADLQLVKHCKNTCVGEVERTQAKDGEDFCGVDDERFFRDREDGRDTVHREDQSGIGE